MKVYIAGPMRGYPEFNFPAFDAATAKYRAMGFDVISPADHDREVQAEGRTVEFKEVIGWDLQAITTCTGIVCLPGWERSVGATLEVNLAKAIGLTIYYEDGAVRKDTLLERAQALVSNERVRQVGKWGTQRVPHDTWLRILAEEFGEIAMALNDHDPIEHVLEEVIQTAAVAVSWAEHILEIQDSLEPAGV